MLFVNIESDTLKIADVGNGDLAGFITKLNSGGVLTFETSVEGNSVSFFITEVPIEGK
jgi:hypothetical protein